VCVHVCSCNTCTGGSHVAGSYVDVPYSKYGGLGLGLAISDKKLFHGRRNRWNSWFVQAEFWLFRGTENSRNFVPNCSAEEKNVRNSVAWNKNISRLSNSVLNHSAEQKTLGIPFRTILQRSKMLGIQFLGKKISKKQTLGILFRSMSRTKT
jgi:hypothetical protein